MSLYKIRKTNGTKALKRRPTYICEDVWTEITIQHHAKKKYNL